VASTEAGIQGNLLVAGGGSRGLVFTVDSQGYKHIFNAVNSNGRVYFYDAQFARAGSFAGARQVYFYRTN
jgi:hypothetical protein